MSFSVVFSFSIQKEIVAACKNFIQNPLFSNGYCKTGARAMRVYFGNEPAEYLLEKGIYLENKKIKFT